MVRIRITGLNKATEQIKTAVFAGARDGLARSALRGEELVRGFIEHPPFGRPIIATGILHSSIASEFSDQAGLGGRAVIFAQPPGGDYAAYVEAGTGPHFPPPRALLLWVKKKFPAEATTEKKALSIAWAVAKTIAKRGTLGRGMFNFAFRQLVTELQDIFERKIAESLERAGVAS